MKNVTLYLTLIFALWTTLSKADDLERYISNIDYGTIGGCAAEVTLRRVDANTTYVSLSWNLSESVSQDDLQIVLTPAFKADFNWAPHLTPEQDNIIGQHVFRSPALVVQGANRTLAVVPDLDILKRGTPVPVYMDMDAQNNTLTLGMSGQHVWHHVLYKRTPGAEFPAGKVVFGFYIFHSDSKSDMANPYRRLLSFMWEHWGADQYKKDDIQSAPYDNYVKHTYNWAFRNWGDQVWQEFEIDGKRVGAPVFIVNTTQSPNYPGPVNEREFRSIWNQAWFSSLRSASGLYRYAVRTGDNELKSKALMTKELALAFPQQDGLFYGLIGTGMTEVEDQGQKCNRSTGWNNYFWGNSNRNPYTWDASIAPFHILDMSWTGLLMLRWYDELERDQRLVEYSETYAQKLLSLQSPKGYFPAWIDTKTGEVMPLLNESPETSMSVTFLLKLHSLTGREEYLVSALRAMEVVMTEIVPEGRWEDFETYWSCCRLPQDKPGRKAERNNMYKQCNFSMFWSAEALLECYKLTGDKRYLSCGERVLDELLMTQASWQPPYIYVSALGGFGVMNTDGEWNDSRSSLFAELILDYGKITKRKEYEQRGMAALRNAFVMMYCPENMAEKQQWEYAWPFFDQKDYGFTMENYGHGGATGDKGMGIGEFTIYDWGNGAAAEAYNRIKDHHPKFFKK